MVDLDHAKVIKGLEWILNDIEENGHYHVDYYADEIREAIALLKEQEPHLLTLDEADAAEVVWFEARNHIFIEPMLTRGKRLADEAEDWFQYGRDWRCWSARPTDKQREEEPWDEITG